jgi:hypothetical protein
MRETASTGFLIRGTKEKSEDDVFQGYHLHQIPLRTFAGCLSLLHTDAYRVHCVYNSGTIRVQICSNSMVILVHIKRNGRHFSPVPLLAHLSR